MAQGWAGLGWLGWAGWLGCLGWAALAGWLAGWARPLPGIGCRLLEPTPESLQINIPRIRFVDFWSQGQKVIKSSCLGLAVTCHNGKRKRLQSDEPTFQKHCVS